RVTLRERASLQGFPITFQLAGRTYSDRLKMIGNAIPPLFVYYMGSSMTGRTANEVSPQRQLGLASGSPAPLPDEIKPRARKPSYPDNRRFRAVVPGLRFGSGVRFELVNNVDDSGVSWRVDFYFGTSKSIQSLELSGPLVVRSLSALPKPPREQVNGALR